MQNKRAVARKRRSDICCYPKASRSGCARTSKSLNDIRSSVPENRVVSSRACSLRRQSACLDDQDDEGNEDALQVDANFSLPRRRGKRPVDEAPNELRHQLTIDVGEDTSDCHCGKKKSCSTTNVAPDYRKRPYPLHSQMSDPSDRGPSTPRGGRKRDSCGKSLMDFTGNEPRSVSYSALRFKGNFDPLSCSWPTLTLNGYSSGSKAHVRGRTLEDCWKSAYAAMVTSQAIGLAPATVRNPNKALLTLEYPSTKILIGNDAAHRLFAVGHDQLVGHRLTDMIANNASTLFSTERGPMAEDGDLVNGQEKLTAACGKVIEIVDALDMVSPAAIWLYPLLPNHSANSDRTFDRCLAVLESVERVTASCTLGPKGRIFACDDCVADMFGYRSSTEILGFNINEILPALLLPTSKHCTEQFRQNLTGRFRNGASFPVTVKLLPEFDGDDVVKYAVTFYVYTTISGLITILPNGTVHSFNDHFVSTMFGLRPDSLNGKPITSIIPKFYTETAAALTGVTDSPSVAESALGSPIFLRCSELSLTDRGGWSNSRLESGSSSSLLILQANRSPSSTSATINGAGTPAMTRAASGTMFASTPGPVLPLTSPITVDGDINDNAVLDEDSYAIPEGSFWGFGLHRDGSLIGIGYQIRKQVLKDGSVLYCIWVVRDPEALICHNLSRFGTLDDSRKNGTDSLFDSVPDLLNCTSKVLPAPNKAQLDLESAEREYIRGVYAQHYDTLQQIGKGAYGCVKMAARKSDGLLVVTKFIRKDRVLTDCWTEDASLGRIPLEISLLLKLKHENIVRVIDVYQNETYFQMVMEKHGTGMDLFEFIDRHPLMDEKLASYIFRQVVSAVSYLHSLNIVHRDIKDENVIIDERFRCKLIDFGSAAYFKEGRTFSTICGTIEYCSPEVLAGNRYTGPELEMWSLGILLYTLVFFENPFDSVEETIQANLEAPWDISEGLFHLLSWLLHPDLHNRATISDVERHWWVTQTVDIKQYKFEEIIIMNDFRDLTPPKYLADLKSAVSTQTSPALSQLMKSGSVS